MGRSWPRLGNLKTPQTLRLPIFRENLCFRTKVVSRRVLGRSWVDLGRQKGSFWEAFWDLSWVKKGKALRCEKRPRLAMPWGGVHPIVVRQLWPGSDKGETELRLPLRLLFGLCRLYIVLLWLSCKSLVAFCCFFLSPCLLFVFCICLAFVQPLFCPGLIVVFPSSLSGLCFVLFLFSLLGVNLQPAVNRQPWRRYY